MDIKTKLKTLFTQHPHSINETYLEHAWFASKVAFGMLCCSFALFIHAVFPFFFVETASKHIHALHSRFCDRDPK